MTVLAFAPPPLPTQQLIRPQPQVAVTPTACARPLRAAGVMLAAAALAVSCVTHPRAEALGVHDGLLDLCEPPGPSCVSSQDDTPSSFLEPWQYDATPSRPYTLIRDRLVDILLSERGAELTVQEPRYIRIQIPIRPSSSPLPPPPPPSSSAPSRVPVDVVELYFPPDDDIVHFRAVPSPRKPDLLRNRGRLQRVRVQADLTAVPVLRGRAPLLGVLESPFDRFAPTAPDADAVIERSGVTSRPARRGADADF